MGIGFVLFIFGLLGLASAFALSKIGAYLAVRWMRDGGDEAAVERAMRAAALLPYACLAWAAAVFIFAGFINSVYLGRDALLGDTAQTPLPNGYALLFVDGDATVFNPATQHFGSSIGNQQDAIFGVLDLQLAGPRMLGDFEVGFPPTHKAGAPRRYFVLDTRSGVRGELANANALRDTSSALGITLAVEPIDTVFTRYRWTWFDLLAAILLVVPPMIVVGLIAKSVVRIRRAGERGVAPAV
jgi:hypothetical protein